MGFLACINHHFGELDYRIGLQLNVPLKVIQNFSCGLKHTNQICRFLYGHRLTIILGIITE